MILSGTEARDAIASKLKKELAYFAHIPELVIIQVGNKDRSEVYTAQKKKYGESLGIPVHLHVFPEDTSQDEISTFIQKQNKNVSIGGIIVQLPLPINLDSRAILDTILPIKDIDGLGTIQSSLLYTGSPKALAPATARGIMSLFDYYGIALSGKHVVVVGRSALVGKPVALLCLEHDATVTVCHSKTENLKEVTRTADILIVAAGKKGLIDASYVTPGHVVIDVGIHKTEEGLSGDVDFDSVSPIVSAITPVPGGVGPMTVISLFQNLLDAYRQQQVV